MFRLDMRLCHEALEKTRNARLIIPVIAHALARRSPRIKAGVVKAIGDDPTLAGPTYININEQFKQLVYTPLRTTGAGVVDKQYEVVVIDASGKRKSICSFLMEYVPE